MDGTSQLPEPHILLLDCRTRGFRWKVIAGAGFVFLLTFWLVLILFDVTVLTTETARRRIRVETYKE
jgi:hypothetical protein